VSGDCLGHGCEALPAEVELASGAHHRVTSTILLNRVLAVFSGTLLGELVDKLDGVVICLAVLVVLACQPIVVDAAFHAKLLLALPACDVVAFSRSGNGIVDDVASTTCGDGAVH